MKKRIAGILISYCIFSFSAYGQSPDFNQSFVLLQDASANISNITLSGGQKGDLRHYALLYAKQLKDISYYEAAYLSARKLPLPPGVELTSSVSNYDEDGVNDREFLFEIEEARRNIVALINLLDRQQKIDEIELFTLVEKIKTATKNLGD